MLGPVIGAALLAFFPIAGIMLMDIAGAVFAIVCLLFVRIPDIPRTDEKARIFSNMKVGLQAMKANKPFMAAFVPLILNNVIYMPLVSLFPLLVRTHFMGEAWHNSIAQFSYAGGLLFSSVVLGIWGGMRKRFHMVSMAIGIGGMVSLLSGTLPSGGFWVFAICCFFMGASGTFIGVPFMAYTQESFPPEKLGKVFSMWFTTMSLAIPVGLLAAGPVSEAVGVDKWFFWSGLVLLAAAVFFRLRTKPYDGETMKP
jgi:DHA3 family macrolide efflux protein-like MFS transporter